MKTSNQRNLKILTFVGLFCISIPILILGLWSHAVNLGANHAERQRIFYSYFPDFLNGRYDSTYLSLVFCVLAIILSSICLKLSRKIWKLLNIIILFISILLLLFNFWGLM